jgi:hypothetical protein
MRRILLGMLALVLAACGGDDDEPDNAGAEFDAPACFEWTDRDVTAEEVAGGCADAESVKGTAVHECDDGRRLWWNDFGWGYVGEVAAQHAPGSERIAPAADRDACPA